jgi:hypothetical protein
VKVLITSIMGQDGSYLGDFLLTQGDRVVGMVRRASTENFEVIENLRGNGTRKKSHFSRNGSPSIVAEYENSQNPFPLRKAWVARCLELHKDRVGINRDIIERAGRREADGIPALVSLHLACAEVAGAEYFLTCDDRVMGRYAGSLKVLNPLDLVVSVVGVQPWQ